MNGKHQGNKGGTVFKREEEHWELPKDKTAEKHRERERQ
jgi:hypothetical protein